MKVSMPLLTALFIGYYKGKDMGYSPNFRGTSAKGSSRQLASGYQNGAGGTLLKATPVSINTNGQLIPVDVSDENNVRSMVGLTMDNIPNAATGQVIDFGRLENISTSFPLRTLVFIDKSGNLTDIEPAVGVNGFLVGDFSVFVGIIVKNEFNPLQKDLKLMLTLAGQL
jgi:hypothetical protein